MHVTQYWLKFCTSLNIGLNFGGGTTDLSENSIAQAPTNTTYWTDETTQTALGVDFDNYTLTQDTSASTTTYLIQSETDLAFLSWTIYNNKAYNNHKSGSYFYSDIYFKQTTNLDLSAYYWQPIGISYTRSGTSARRYFSGNYDGGGYTVSGVFTPAGTGNGYSHQGLFGYVYDQSLTNKATIKNIGVIDSFIHGKDYVGGVVGYAYYATITNCYNAGSVSGSTGVGGVVGGADDSTITSSYNTGAVSGTGDYVGGVVGSAGYNVTITNVYNTGSVSGDSQVAGVVGNVYKGSTITNCYNTGSVEGTGTHIGGVVGHAYTNLNTTNCYNTGSVSGSDDYVGGVVGYAPRYSTITNCYNTGSVSGDSVVGGVVGYAYRATVSNTYYGGACTLPVGIGSGSGSAKKIDSPVEEWAKNEEWYLNSSNWDSSYPWNFETVWAIGDGVPNYVVGGGYPYLQSLGMTKHEIIYWTDEVAQEALGVDFDNYTLTQDSSASTTTYLIQSETDLAYLSWTIYNDNPFGCSSNKVLSDGVYCFYPNITFKQTKDLNLSDYYWQPIGIGCTRDGTSADRYFSGKYDGGGFTVSGVFTPDGTGDEFSRQGLFGTARSINSSNKVTINNVKMVNSFIRGYWFVGSVIGVAGSNTTISNCYSASSVTGVGYVGGVVGYSYDKAIITNCYYTGSFKGTGNTNIGGIVGELEASTIENCGVEGAMISGSSNVGIFVGTTINSLATVKNCYAIVDEALSPYVTNSGTFTNCLWIAGGVKYRYGTDFSGFAWPNADSCPVPKSLSWIGQFWTGDITAEIMASSEWTEWVA